jgi:hypothetical protein
LWFAIVGFWFLLAYRQLAIPIILAILYLWLVQSLFWIEARYMRPIYPVLIFLTALGLVTFCEKAVLWWRSQKVKLPSLRQKVKRDWLIAPILSLSLICIMLITIKGDDYKYTFDWQLFYVPLIFDEMPQAPYYKAAMPQLLNNLLALKEMLVAEHPLTKSSPPPILGEPADRQEDPYRLSTINTYIARVYFRLGDYDNAINYTTYAIEGNKNNFEAYHWRSLAWAILGKYDQAKTDRETFDKLVPERYKYIGNLTY